MSEDAKPDAAPVRQVIDNSQEVLPAAPQDAEDGPPPPREHEPILPAGCPVIPLGKLGNKSFYIDAIGQLRDKADTEHGRLGILDLVGTKTEFLYEHWPRRDKEGNVVGWRPELCAEKLMAAAAREGIWNPSERIRGRGAWKGGAGELILHCGDRVLQGDSWQAPGKIGRYVYPAEPAILRPWEKPTGTGDQQPGKRLFMLLQRWRFDRGDLDARLLLGWTGAAMLGGAIDWRPVVWITGGPGTGKSTLHKLLALIFGDALISVSDATAAGIWQKVAHSTLPVALDEFEAEEDGRGAQAKLKLIRQAASGGLVLRGGSDHSSTEFKARSCFLASSVLLPSLLPADRSRIAILKLGTLGTEPEPDLDPGSRRDLGRQLLRRLVDQWNRWNETLTVYRAALQKAGHGARGADVFGTLLAMADLLLHDGEPNHDFAHELAQQLDVVGLAEREDDATDEEQILQHLLTSSLPLDGGGVRRSVGELVRRAHASPFLAEGSDAAEILGTYGLKVTSEDGKQGLAIANKHVGLARLFAGTHWAAKSGGSSVWKQALRRLPGAAPSKNGVRFAGALCRATVLPISLVLAPGSEPSAQRYLSDID